METSLEAKLKSLKHSQKGQEEGSTSAVHAHTSSGGKSKSHLSRKVRGPTMGQKLLTVYPNRKLKVEFNEEGQPIGAVSDDLILWLGTYARNGKYFPLTYKDWRLIPNSRKDLVWELLKDAYEFDDPEAANRWIFQSLGNKWRSFKCRLKKYRYNVHNNDTSRIKDRDPRVDELQWKKLVRYWGTQEAKALSKKNQLISSHSMHHSAGTKCIACVRDEETKKRTDGSIPRREEIFILTHTRKDNTYTDSASEEVASKLMEVTNAQQSDPTLSSGSDPVESSYCKKNDVYAQVRGPERHGRVCGVGLGVTPTQLWGASFSSQAKRREAKLIRENKEMRERLTIAEDQLIVMGAEITELKQLVM